MEPVDPRINPSLVPEGSKPYVIAERQKEFVNLPAIITPNQRVITRWKLTAEERQALIMGEDIFLVIFGTPIRPVFLSVGVQDVWS